MMKGKAPTIFIVNDEPIIADTLALILRGNDFDARSFYSSEAALGAAESSAPHLVICDVAMPAMTGIELAIYFRACYPTCKVLLFSGQANTANRLQNIYAQRYDFEVLNKPAYPADFLAKNPLSRPSPAST